MASVRPADCRFGAFARFYKAVLAVACTAAVVTLCACFGGGQKRPAGFFKLGSVAELARPSETFFSDLKILLRRDSGGFYAMSTACTYDLSSLVYSERSGKLLWRSQYTESAYAPDGSVVHGPAKAPLPYYKLAIAPGTIGGPADTLFVEVGIERDPSWRLPIPAFLAGGS